MGENRGILGTVWTRSSEVSDAQQLVRGALPLAAARPRFTQASKFISLIREKDLFLKFCHQVLQVLPRRRSL